jgi:hypothetical protein
MGGGMGRRRGNVSGTGQRLRHTPRPHHRKALPSHIRPIKIHLRSVSPPLALTGGSRRRCAVAVGAGRSGAGSARLQVAGLAEAEERGFGAETKHDTNVC